MTAIARRIESLAERSCKLGDEHHGAVFARVLGRIQGISDQIESVSIVELGDILQKAVETEEALVRAGEELAV